MAKTITHNIDGQSYEVPEGYSELDVRRALSQQKQPAKASTQLRGAPKVTGKYEKDIMPSNEFGYGIKRKLRESLGGLQEFITGKPSMPLEADLPKDALSQAQRYAGGALTRAGEGLAESLLGARLGSRLGPAGAVVGGIAAPFVAGYLKQPGPRVSGSRALSAVTEALPGALKTAGKEIKYGRELAKGLKLLETDLPKLEEQKLGAETTLAETKRNIPVELERTSRGIEKKLLSSSEALQQLKAKQQELQASIAKDEPFQGIVFDEKGPKPVDLSKIEKLELPKSAKSEIVERNKQQFLDDAAKSFDPNVDYNKLAAEEHNKIYDNISEQVREKYNDVLEEEPESIPATNRGYRKFQQVAKSVGEEIAPLQKLFPDNVEVLSPEEQELVPELQNTQNLRAIPTDKLLSFYKTSKQIAYKLSSKAWQEANGLTETQRKNLDNASEKYSLLTNKLRDVLNEVSPSILEKLSDADTYFAKNKAPFYGRPEHWQAQKKGRITTDILRDTHAAKNVPEAAFLRNLIKTNEGYRSAVLGKLFARNLDKLTKEGNFEEYSDFVQTDPHVGQIHGTLQKFEDIKNKLSGAEKLEKPMAQEISKTVQQLLKAKNEFNTNLAKNLSEKFEQIKKLTLKKQEGYKIKTEELVKVGKDIQQLEKDIEKYEAYKNNLLEAEKNAEKAGYDTKDLKIQIKKARLEYEQHKQKYKKIVNTSKGILAAVAAKLTLFK